MRPILGGAPVTPALLLIVAACAPPPAASGLSIELLYPESDQEVTLDGDCVLREPIVVDIDGLNLVDPAPDNIVDGQGHWHGGPDMENGYCISSDNSCNDYEGRDLSLGRLTLFVELQDNGHNPLGARDQVEVVVVAPSDVNCP